MNLSPKHLIKILEAHGFIYKRAKGYTIFIITLKLIRLLQCQVHGGKDMKKGAFWGF